MNVWNTESVVGDVVSIIFRDNSENSIKEIDGILLNAVNITKKGIEQQRNRFCVTNLLGEKIFLNNKDILKIKKAHLDYNEQELYKSLQSLIFQSPSIIFEKGMEYKENTILDIAYIDILNNYKDSLRDRYIKGLPPKKSKISSLVKTFNIKVENFNLNYIDVARASNIKNIEDLKVFIKKKICITKYNRFNEKYYTVQSIDNILSLKRILEG